MATYLHMLIGEMIPKNIALAAPVPTALLLGPPLVALTRALRPVDLRHQRLRQRPAEAAAGRAEGRGRRRSSPTTSSPAWSWTPARPDCSTPADGERLRDALELGTRPVGEILVPLHEDAHRRPRPSPRRGWSGRPPRRASPASRSPAPDGTLLGYLHIKDTLGVADRDRPFPRSALHPVTRVRIDTPLDDTLTALRAAGSHLAAVTGEKGTVLGFVTMEDVLAELVGPAA